jgi:hypothetical protein
MKLAWTVVLEKNILSTTTNKQKYKKYLKLQAIIELKMDCGLIR